MISIDPSPAGLLRSVSRTDQLVCVAADEKAEKFVITFVDDDGCDAVLSVSRVRRIDV